MFIRRINKEGHLKTIFLNVSEIHITNENEKIKTILGSCVSVVIFVPRLKLSAICHARLPQGKYTPSKKSGCCYVDGSILYMINELLKRGASENEFVIKAFGGAQIVFKNIEKNVASKSIGQQNVAMIKTVLAERGLVLSSYDLGGHSGRKLIYNTHKNDVLIKELTEKTSTENEISLLLKNFIFNR